MCLGRINIDLEREREREREREWGERKKGFVAISFISSVVTLAIVQTCTQEEARLYPPHTCAYIRGLLTVWSVNRA